CIICTLFRCCNSWIALKLFFRHVPFWPNPVKTALNNRRLFILFAYPQNRAMSFTQYVNGLAKVLKGVQEDHQQSMFQT
ncbi:MAG: hypothetical protein M1426_02700, partial [Patescibacteria group bacterium]|nr:hypothetical protein [Patescibacteria group bacterium]